MDSLDFYRKNLKPIMAALTLMAMITFVFDDSMRAGNTTLVPFILAILFGGGAFVLGSRRGKPKEYLAMGALVGAVLGLIVIVFGGSDPHEQPAIAGLKPHEIANLKNRRETANRIVSLIYQKSHPIPEQFLKAGQFGQQFYQMQMQRALEQIQFTFGNDSFEKDVVFGDLLRREADRLGITVNDDAVSDFIKMVSDQKLSTQDFRDVKQELHLVDHIIYDILRDEMAARMAAEMTFPRSVATPQQRWEAFRKVNVKNSIEATTVPVEAFVNSVPDPSDSELQAFFKTHAEKFPTAKGDPGFRQPDRVRLAYLEADYETIEAKVPQPTDEEVAKYYEDNKEFFIDRTPPKTDKKEDATEGDDAKKPEADDVKKSDDKKDEKSDKPTEKKVENKPDEPKVDKPKSDSTPEPDKSDKPTEPKKPEKPKDDPPAEEAKSENKKELKSEGSKGDDEVEAVKKPDDSKKDEPKAEAEKTEDNKSEKKADAPKADAEKSVNKEEAKADDKKPAEKPKADSQVNKPADEKDKTEESAKPAEKPEEKPELKYKPLEEVQDKILDDLLRTRTLEEMKKRIESVVVKMRRLGSYTIAEKTSKSYKSPEDVASELKELANSADLKYVQTPWLSAEELSKSEEFKIGSATEPSDAAANRQGAISVIQQVFGRGNDSLFAPDVAEDPGTKNRFAYWVIERKEAHVPKFADEGIREQVTKAWKLSKAAPKAEERAKALAKLGDGKPLTEVLAGETVTGEKDGLALTVIAPEQKISHFTLSGASAPGVNPFQGGEERIELSQIPGLDKLGDDFFAGIDKLNPGQTAALPNFDRSAFIVVHVTEREDVAAEEDAPQRADFMKTWPFSQPANQLASFDFDPLRREWMESIERKYHVKWPVR